MGSGRELLEGFGAAYLVGRFAATPNTISIISKQAATGSRGEETSKYGFLSRLSTPAANDLGVILLLENRIILLQGEIHDGNANELVMKLLYLQSENRRKGIHFYINSPGGSVSATLAIDTRCKSARAPWPRIGVGLAASGGAVLLAGGTKGKRFALPNAKVMIHQPYGLCGWAGFY